MARPRGSAADHRVHRDPPGGRETAQRWGEQARLAVVVRHRRRRAGHRPVLAGFLRRFEVEHTFRLLKQTLGWTRPKVRASLVEQRRRRVARCAARGPGTGRIPVRVPVGLRPALAWRFDRLPPTGRAGARQPPVCDRLRRPPHGGPAGHRPGDPAAGLPAGHAARAGPGLPTAVRPRAGTAVHRTVVARLQHRTPEIDSDVGWATIAATTLTIRGLGETECENAWVGELDTGTMLPLRRPGHSSQGRVVAEEREMLPGDPPALKYQVREGSPRRMRGAVRHPAHRRRAQRRARHGRGTPVCAAAVA